MPRINRAVAMFGTLAVLALAGLLIWFATTAYRLYGKPPHSIGLSDCTRLGVTDFEELRTGRRTSAYQAMSTPYRSRLTSEQFSAFLDDYPLLNSHAFVRQGEVFGLAAGPDAPLTGVRICYTLLPARLPAADPHDEAPNDPKTDRRKLDLTLHFVEENGRWFVDQITFP